MTIKSLPPDVVNLIAAGEVIDSLAAVVRELVENAIDAGATRLVISLYPELWKLQVVDNGRGMSLIDLKLCGQAHSTSKIYRRDDLWKITSLGFRGEALHSIAQVAELEIASRPINSQQSGWQIIYDSQGETVTIEPAAIAGGTIVTVSNLFGNFPVRRKGLPPLKQQLKTVQILIQDLALSHPQITWIIEQNNRSWFQVSPGKTTKEILPQFLKRVHQSDLCLLTQIIETPKEQGTENNFSFKSQSQLELVIGLPDRCHRQRPDWVKIAINGRVVKIPPLEHSLLSGFSRSLPRDRFPICFLHLQTCPSQIDWNRHPAKTEIYLHSLNFWQNKIAYALEEALRLNADILPESAHHQRVEKLLKVSENKQKYKLQSLTTDKTKNNDFSLLDLKAISQIHQTYIVAEHCTGLWLIEQHIAHERVLYEQLQEQWIIIPLETPILFNQLTTNQVEQLQNIGLNIELFGEQLWMVRSAPKILSKREDCSAALIELSLGGDLETAQVATACRSAIRNGTPLDLAQMQTLLNQWKNTRNPRTCPHGRPIYLPLEETALARFFRRHWVIGKSHGI
jgi:DNA mismatch repair protein MutL